MKKAHLTRVGRRHDWRPFARARCLGVDSQAASLDARTDLELSRRQPRLRAEASTRSRIWPAVSRCWTSFFESLAAARQTTCAVARKPFGDFGTAPAKQLRTSATTLWRFACPLNAAGAGVRTVTSLAAGLPPQTVQREVVGRTGRLRRSDQRVAARECRSCWRQRSAAAVPAPRPHGRRGNVCHVWTPAHGVGVCRHELSVVVLASCCHGSEPTARQGLMRIAASTWRWIASAASCGVSAYACCRTASVSASTTRVACERCRDSATHSLPGSVAKAGASR